MRFPRRRAPTLIYELSLSATDGALTGPLEPRATAREPGLPALRETPLDSASPNVPRWQSDPLMDDPFGEGIRLFNSQKFFECHEALEALWLESAGEEKLFLHGLIQVAAAFHHQQRGNRAGARSLLEKGWKKLVGFGPRRRGIDLVGLRSQLKTWREYIKRPEETGGASPRPAPSLPRIKSSR
jgi:hypothetical protein